MAPFFALEEEKREQWRPKTRVSKKGFLKQRLEELYAEDQDWSVEKKINIAKELNMTLSGVGKWLWDQKKRSKKSK